MPASKDFKKFIQLFLTANDTKILEGILTLLLTSEEQDSIAQRLKIIEQLIRIMLHNEKWLNI